MSTSHNRSSKHIARTAVVVTTTGFAALALAGPASAETAKTVLSQGWSAGCTGNKPMGDCDAVSMPFTNTVDKLRITVTQGNSFCARSIAEVYVDNQNHPSRRIGDWQQEPLTINVPPGNHTITLNLRSLGTCKDGVPPVMTGNLVVEELVPDKAPPGQNPGQTIEVASDVDVYDKPGGQAAGAKVKGILFAETNGAPTVVGIYGCQRDNWCHVHGPAVPTGTGWVWGAHLKR